MAGQDFLSIETQTMDVTAAVAQLSDPTHGAADIFVGKVRNHNLGKVVEGGVSYDVFDELALNVFRELCVEARKQWGDDLDIHISHFKGRLAIGGVSIVIGVSSRHRDESFKACRFLIEEIKHRAPIWKQEHYFEGDSEWIQGYALNTEV